MQEENIAELRRRFPWLPLDCATALTAMVPGRRRYGIEWFEQPRRPADVAGAGVGQAFPTAWWIGRRNGNPVGYEPADTAAPALYEWGGSQRRRLAHFAGIDALALSQINPDADRRALVEVEIEVRGLAFGPWRSGGDFLDAPCMFSVGLGNVGVENIIGRLGIGWELLLMEEDRDAALCVHGTAAGYELRRIGHGHFGAWVPASQEATRAACTALVSRNDGSDAWSFGKLSLPAPAPGSSVNVR